MNNQIMKTALSMAGSVIIAVTVACSGARGSRTSDTVQASQEGASVGDSAAMIARNLMKFDTLDYVGPGADVNPAESRVGVS